jgi:isoprenylcysteine carboxyl methyltransferase (ICMT) family protein YpbQ
MNIKVYMVIVAFNNKKALFTNNGLKYEGGNSKLLQLEHSLMWCCNVEISGSISEIPGKGLRSSRGTLV